IQVKQNAPLITCEDGYFKPREEKQAPLKTYTAASLYGKRLQHPPQIIQGMVPVGLTVFAGAPKRGKSWMALRMALDVAAGKPFLGNATLQGDVLYLDLESRQYRVQARLSALIQGQASPGLSIAHEADTLDGNLLWQLQKWADGSASPRLVIIDTLGRVKGKSARGENAYEADTRIFGELQRFAQERQLAVMCVHHLRKTKESDDWYERISGSMGLTGVADAVLGLDGKRGEATSTLHVSGRDFDERDMLLRFSQGNWMLMAEDSEKYQEDLAYAGSRFLQGVVLLMHTRAEWQGEPSDLLAAAIDTLGEPVEVSLASEAGKLLNRFAQRLYDDMGILINAKKSNGRRKITLRNVRFQPSLVLVP
ncbi:MAG: AAA family ATPase, partial [Clostridiales bacterium]|nr:AAA family ATPase [Clostridiales bacterium]